MYRLWLLEALRADSSVSRVKHCRYTPLGAGGWQAEANPKYRRAVREDGSVGVYVSGLQTCGRITCPVCGARIRQAERATMRMLAAAHLAAGGALYTSTLTLSHGPHDDPTEVLDALYAARSKAVGSKGGGAWAKDRKRHGIVGVTWHLDPPPIGKNGMHWHLHLLWFVERPLSNEGLDELEERVYGRYANALEAQGKRASRRYNRIQPVLTAEKAASYVAKSDAEKRDPARSISAEVARGDLKTAKGVLPLHVLEAWADTGDYAQLAIYHRYEQAMDGRTWRYKPHALLARYAVDTVEIEEDLQTPAEDTPEAQAAAVLEDATDAADAVGGVVVLDPGVDGWRAIQATRGADRRVRSLLMAWRDAEARAYVEGLTARHLAEPG